MLRLLQRLMIWVYDEDELVSYVICSCCSPCGAIEVECLKRIILSCLAYCNTIVDSWFSRQPLIVWWRPMVSWLLICGRRLALPNLHSKSILISFQSQLVNSLWSRILRGSKPRHVLQRKLYLDPCGNRFICCFGLTMQCPFCWYSYAVLFDAGCYFLLLIFI